VLCIDELGYMELDKRGAELLFQVLTEREEKASVAIASNESFSKPHMFPRTCVRRRRKWTGSRLADRGGATERACGCVAGALVDQPPTQARVRTASHSSRRQIVTTVVGLLARPVLQCFVVLT
jgi:IstB-like ATP binding protein